MQTKQLLTHLNEQEQNIDKLNALIELETKHLINRKIKEIDISTQKKEKLINQIKIKDEKIQQFIKENNIKKESIKNNIEQIITKTKECKIKSNRNEKLLNQALILTENIINTIKTTEYTVTTGYNNKGKKVKKLI